MGAEQESSAPDLCGDAVSLAESSLTHRDPASTPFAAEGKHESIHQRLYGLKDKIKATKLADPSPRMVEEMQACTFAPQMASSFHHRKDVSVSAPAPPTVRAQQVAEKSIQRIRTVHEQKVRKAAEDSHEAQQERLNQSYARSRELARRGVVPFKFVLAENQQDSPVPPAHTSPGRSPARKRTDPE